MAQQHTQREWSEAQKRAVQKRESNPNSYYYRFNEPNETQKNGAWSLEEKTAFIQRLSEFDFSQGYHWGLFSISIPGRVGYQCSNFYRKLIQDGEIHDPNYIIEDGKLKFKLIPSHVEQSQQIPPEKIEHSPSRMKREKLSPQNSIIIKKEERRGIRTTGTGKKDRSRILPFKKKKKKKKAKRTNPKEPSKEENVVFNQEQVAFLPTEGTEIIDGIFIGGKSVAKNLDWLLSNHIVAIVNVSREVKNFHPSHFIYHNIKVDDSEEAEFSLPVIECAIKFIEHHLDIFDCIEPKSVLIHCKEGRSRSLTIMIAYLMIQEKKSLVQAFLLVQEKTKGRMNINNGFKQQLMRLESFLLSDKEIQLNTINLLAPAPRTSKIRSYQLSTERKRGFIRCHNTSIVSKPETETLCPSQSLTPLSPSPVYNTYCIEDLGIRIEQSV